MLTLYFEATTRLLVFVILACRRTGAVFSAGRRGGGRASRANWHLQLFSPLQSPPAWPR